MKEVTLLIKLIPGHHHIPWNTSIDNRILIELFYILDRGLKMGLNEFLEKQEIGSTFSVYESGILEILPENKVLITSILLFSGEEIKKQIFELADIVEVYQEYKQLKKKRIALMQFKEASGRITIEALTNDKPMSENVLDEYKDEEILIIQRINDFQYWVGDFCKEDDFLRILWVAIQNIPDFMFEEFLAKKEIGDWTGYNDDGNLTIFPDDKIRIEVLSASDEMKEKYGYYITYIADFDEVLKLQREFNKLKEAKVEGMVFRKKGEKLSVELF